MAPTTSTYSAGPRISAACRRTPPATAITSLSGRPEISCIAPFRIPLGMNSLDSLGCCGTRVRPTLGETRLTLELTYRMGYSVEEIAAISSSPVGTAKARMCRARESLRKHLPALAGGLHDSMQSASEG